MILLNFSSKNVWLFTYGIKEEICDLTLFSPWNIMNIISTV